jgi:phosphoadenosine phosphosulfate reductase
MLGDLWGNYSQEDLYQIAIAQPLEDKIKQAIALIQTYEPTALALSLDGFYVAFSGGKDSIVMERLFRMAGVKYKAWYNNVTIDPPELVRFTKDHYPEVSWNNPEKHMLSKMLEKSNGPPTRLVRWCCEIYKEQGGKGLLQAIGVRAEESARRKGLWKHVTPDRKAGIILCPILYWTETDIWQFIHDNDMPYCSLYDEVDSNGVKLFKRLGCIGCPMGGPRGQAKDFARWPAYEIMWRKAFQGYWDRWKDVPRNDGGERWISKFPDVDALWNWWISGKAYEGENADCQGFLW